MRASNAVVRSSQDFEWNNPRYGKLKLIPGAAAKLVSTDRGPMLNTDISFRVKHEESVYEMMQQYACACIEGHW